MLIRMPRVETVFPANIVSELPEERLRLPRVMFPVVRIRNPCVSEPMLSVFAVRLKRESPTLPGRDSGAAA